MSVIKEIQQFANDADKPILLWLISKYNMQSQWQFVATCTHEKYGRFSYQTNRIWKPTKEGRILYDYNKTVHPILEEGKVYNELL